MPVPGLQSTLARRLHVLVLLVAPIPLGLMAWTAIGQYQRQLTAETEHRLAERAKEAGLDVFARLESLKSDLAFVSGGGGGSQEEPRSLAVPEALRTRFRALAVAAPGAAPAGAEGPLPDLDPVQVKRILERRAVLLTAPAAGRPAAVWLIVPLPTRRATAVFAEVQPDWLFRAADTEAAPGHAALLVDAESRTPIASSLGLPPELAADLSARDLRGSGGFLWRTAGGEVHRARYWTAPLGFEYGYPGLSTVASEMDVLTPAVGALRNRLLLVALAALLVAWLVGLVRLRTDLAPLTALRDGTRRLAEGDFAARVEIARPADLADLGDAFNGMARRIERQFNLLDAARSVAVAALAPTPRDEEVARTFVERTAGLVGDAEVVVVLHERPGPALVFRGASRGGPVERFEAEHAAPLGLPATGSEGEWVDLDQTLPFLRPGHSGRHSRWRQLRHGGRWLASVGIVDPGAAEVPEASAALVDELGDQLAIALFRVRLMEDLERANWGALNALARAVDAKSSWTLGHSSRVAEIAAALALQVGWSEEEIRVVRRGCLLHDVGKIGVPGKVLDKPTRLDPAEIAMLRTHVEKGVRIIEPVEGLAEVLPIIAQHHERLDGSGSPKGLHGSEIHPQALLVAIADVFEALTAPRPYREALSGAAAEEYLTYNTGTLFAPQYVDALHVVRRKGLINALLDPTALPA